VGQRQLHRSGLAVRPPLVGDDGEIGGQVEGDGAGDHDGLVEGGGLHGVEGVEIQRSPGQRRQELVGVSPEPRPAAGRQQDGGCRHQ
jgi:hypothetical protein